MPLLKVEVNSQLGLNIIVISSHHSWVDLRVLPDIVMALDVDFVKDPFRGLQEILFHLHSYVPGQQTH